MHIYGISKKELAKEAGYDQRYVGQILNGKKNPKHGEAVLRFALERLIAQKKGDG
jgi:predicted transcriptional regulator